jgi:hypothetical protein
MSTMTTRPATSDVVDLDMPSENIFDDLVGDATS